MLADDFQREALRPASLTDLDNLNHFLNSTHGAGLSPQDNAALIMGSQGLSGEAGEVVDYLKKVVFHGHPLEIEKVKKELGDVVWYVARICSALHINLSDVMSGNLDKLLNRYPNGFSTEASLNRAD